MMNKIFKLYFIIVLSIIPLLFACSGDTGSSEEEEGLVQKIIFTRYIASNNEIFIMNPDGTEETQLTDNVYNERDPVLSSDGTKIVFDRESNIFIMNADGTGEKQLTDTAEDDRPCISPDGTRIAFTSESNAIGSGSDIYIMDIDGGNRVNITNNDGWDFKPRFSPDGSKIVFVSDRDSSDYEIYIMNTDGTGQTRLTQNDGEDLDPCFTPDGQKIIFRSVKDYFINYIDPPTGSDIYIMDIDGSNQTKITDNSDYESNPCVSPDGTALMFTKGSNEEEEIYMINIDGSDEIQITDNDFEDDAPYWGYVDKSMLQ